MSTASALQHTTLEVRNFSTRPVIIQVDGQSRLQLVAGSSARLETLEPGRHHLTARSDQDVLDSLMANLPRGGAYVWNLRAPAGTQERPMQLRIRNYAGQRVQIFVQGVPRLEIDPGDSAVMNGLMGGLVKLEARGLDGRLIAQTIEELVPGLELVWLVQGVQGPVAVLEVHNALPILLKVALDGGPAQRLAPHSSLQLNALAPGHHRLTAFNGETGQPVDSLDADLAPNTPYDWVIGEMQ